MDVEMETPRPLYVMDESVGPRMVTTSEPHPQAHKWLAVLYSRLTYSLQGSSFSGTNSTNWCWTRCSLTGIPRSATHCHQRYTCSCVHVRGRCRSRSASSSGRPPARH